MYSSSREYRTIDTSLGLSRVSLSFCYFRTGCISSENIESFNDRVFYLANGTCWWVAGWRIGLSILRVVPSLLFLLNKPPRVEAHIGWSRSASSPLVDTGHSLVFLLFTWGLLYFAPLYENFKWWMTLYFNHTKVFCIRPHPWKKCYIINISTE